MAEVGFELGLTETKEVSQTTLGQELTLGVFLGLATLGMGYLALSGAEASIVLTETPTIAVEEEPYIPTTTTKQDTTTFNGNSVYIGG